MDLDVATVQAITVLPFALMALFLGWTWWAQRSSLALVWWSLSFAFAAGSALLTWLDNGRALHVNVIVDDILFLLAHLALLAGFRAFIGRPLPWGLSAAALAGYGAVAMGIEVADRELIRAAVAIGAVLTLVAALEFARWRERRLVWRRIVIAILLVHLVILALRLVTGPEAELDDAGAAMKALGALFLLAPILIPIGLGYTMLGMVYERRTAALRSAALRDPLTGALNRLGLEEWLAYERQRPDGGRRRSETPALAAIAVDVDHFKAINDTFGHAAGDLVLRALVDRLSGEVRPEDAIARFGGEEFVVLMPRMAARDAIAAAERMRCLLTEAPVEADGRPVALTASFGVALDRTLPSPEGLAGLLDRADKALYRAKREGRNRVVAEDGLAAAI